MNNRRMWGLRSCVLTFLYVSLWCIDSHGQYDLQFQGPEKIDWCQSATYDFRLDRFTDSPVEDLVLNITFDHAVAYLSNSLGLLITPEDPRSITLDLNEFEQCGYLSGSIEVFPSCASSLATLGTTATLLNGPEVLNSRLTSALIGAVTMQMTLGPYSFDGLKNQLSKTIILTNVNTSSIEQFDIELIYSEDFAVLSESSVGTIDDRNYISFGPDDLPNGSLKSLETIEVHMTSDLLTCNVGFIRYKMVLGCEQFNCSNSQIFVDDNRVDEVLPLIIPPAKLNYGICEPVFNQVVVKHENPEYIGVLEDAYGLSFTFNLIDRNLSYLSCIAPIFRIGNMELFAILTESLEGFYYSIPLTDITSNIDGDGGLQDLDGDGRYNDLERGDSIVIDIGVYYKEECEFVIRPISPQLGVSVLDLCDNPIYAPISRSVIPGSHDISAVPLTDLPKDVNGDRYHRIGDTVLWKLNYRYSQNVDPRCLNTDMLLNIVIPPSLVWVEGNIIFQGTEDSVSWTVTKMDSLLVIPFDGSKSGVFHTYFVAQCPEDPIRNFDPSIPIVEQCVAWNIYNLLATIDNQCGELCDLNIKTNPTYSTSFRTLCEEELVYQNILSVDNFVINRMNGGWMDSAQTIRWDPEIYVNSTNQGIFYDHDTMRIRIPFVFTQSDVVESIRFVIGNLLSSQEIDLEIFQSSLYSYNRDSKALIEKCDLSQYTSDGDRDIILSLNRAAINVLCFEETDSVVWELMVIPNVERSERLESNDYISEGIRLFVEEKIGNCFKRIALLKDNYFITEVFIPKLFDIPAIDFSLGQANLFSLPLGNRRIINAENIDFEYRDQTEIYNVNLIVPQDYELVDEELYLISERLVYDSIFFEDAYISYTRIESDTIVRVSYTSIDVMADNIQYVFDIDSSVYKGISFEESINLVGNIRSICTSVAPQLIVNGVVAYKDHHTGSLDRIELPFDIRSNLRFNPNLISFTDDFKITGSEAKVVWFLNDVETTFNPSFADNRTLIRYLEFNSNGTRLDSMTRLQQVYPDIIFEIAISNEEISQNLYRISDTLFAGYFYSFANLNLNLHTSNSPCGFDTINIRFGQEVLWEYDSCPEAIFEDQLIIHTPVGLPQTRWIRYPEYIDLCDTSWFRWELNNIGEGGLTDVQLRILSAAVQDPQLQVTIDSLTILVESDDLTYENGGYELNLSDIGVDTLFGLIDANRQNIQMDWFWTPDCDSPNLYDVDIAVQAQTYCEEILESRRIQLSYIPLRTLQDTAYSITMNSVSGPVCGDTVMMRVEIGSLSAQQLINDSLLVYLPREYAYYSGSARSNNVQITDPSIAYEGSFQILSWINMVRFSDDQPFELEFQLDSACGDICGRGEGRAILMSRVQASCNGFSCERYSSRAATPLEHHFWRPKMELDITSFEVLSIQNAMMRAVVTWDLSQIRNHIYDGQIQAHYYGDSDGNNLINTDEDIYETKTIYFDESQQLIVTDTIEIIVSDACELSLFIELERDCACFTAAESIGMLERVTTRQEVLLCASETYEVEMAQVEECSRTWSPHARLDLSDLGRPLYNPNLTPDFVGRDTVVGILDCIDCDFVDSIFIDVYKLEPTVVLDMPACNDFGATVSVMIDHPNPESLSYIWNIPEAENSPTIENAPLGLVEVIVTDNQGCSTSAELLIEPYEIAYEVALTGDLCDVITGQSVQILFMGDEDSVTVIWNDGTTGAIREGLSSGLYPFEIISSEGCFVLDTLYLSSSNLSGINYQEVYTIQLGQELNIAPEEVIDNGLTFSWEPSALVNCDSCQEILITPMGQTMLSVTIMDPLGCSKTETITIDVKSNLILYLPNVISRNGDPSNTRLFPSEDPSVDRILSFRIFDRWGNTVMDKENIEPRDASQGWNGTYGNQPASPGVYIYDINVLLIDGTEQRFTSSITLLP